MIVLSGPEKAALIAETQLLIDAIHEKRADDDKRRQDKALRAHEVLGDLIQRVPPNIHVGSWSIQGGVIDILLSSSAVDNGHEMRARLMLLSEQFGLDYDEQAHEGSQNIVTASGTYKQVPVRFWRLLPPCGCGECAVPQ